MGVLPELSSCSILDAEPREARRTDRPRQGKENKYHYSFTSRSFLLGCFLTTQNNTLRLSQPLNNV